MDDQIQDDILFSETSKIVSPSATIPRTTNALPRRRRKNQSAVWNHFTLLPSQPGSVQQARCNYCDAILKCNNGTTSMGHHTAKCLKERNESVSGPANADGNASASPSVARFDQENSRNLLVRMVVGMELPFQHVEHPFFRDFVSSLQPKFSVISRSTLVRDIFSRWETERSDLKKFMSQHCDRICLTADTWTSVQTLSYMSLTAHFIDNNWTLQKRVINFCQVPDTTGNTIATTIEACLSDWGLYRVLTVTLDNASSNDVAINRLKKRYMSWDKLVLKGEYIHMRCCAHILNLVVKDGLKLVDDSLYRIRDAVKYVRCSSSRLRRFKGYVAKVNSDYKGLVCLDCETRWNSTYLMLVAALKHQKAFEELELQEAKYTDELKDGKGVPTKKDWDYARMIEPFLKIFYDTTKYISGSSYVASNIYMLEVFEIKEKIMEMCKSEDANIKEIAEKMKVKYDKYWGNPDKLNMLLLIAVVLDPRYKLKFTSWQISENFSSLEASKLNKKLESCLNELFEEYSGEGMGSQSDSQLTPFISDERTPKSRYGFDRFLQSTGTKSSVQSELSKYLEESFEPHTGLDILNWWKVNSNRFPILAKMARDLLAIPISTVPSESIFSTGGRVLDDYRSSLTPKMVEMLVCMDDWLKGTLKSSFGFDLFSFEDFQELEKLEEGKIYIVHVLLYIVTNFIMI